MKREYKMKEKSCEKNTKDLTIERPHKIIFMYYIDGQLIRIMYNISISRFKRTKT